MSSDPSARPLQPEHSGDEAAAGTPGTGEAICRRCGGNGQLQDQPCPDCGGTGKVIEGIAGG